MAQAVSAWPSCERLLLGLLDLHVDAVVPCYWDTHATPPPLYFLFSSPPPSESLRRFRDRPPWQRSYLQCLSPLTAPISCLSDEECVRECLCMCAQIYAYPRESVTTRTKTEGRKEKKKKSMLELCKCLRPASRVTLALHDLTCHVAVAAVAANRDRDLSTPFPVTEPFLVTKLFRILERE